MNKPLIALSHVLKNGNDDQMVTMVGNVVRQVGREKFLFRDASGEIRIEVDNEVMPPQPFDDKTKVKITGDAEKDFLRSVEIDVTWMKRLPCQAQSCRWPRDDSRTSSSSRMMRPAR